MVEWLGYLALTQVARVQFPVTEIVLKISTRMGFTSFVFQSAAQKVFPRRELNPGLLGESQIS